MKLQYRISLLAATALTALFVTQARAEYRAVGNDGIAASPKVRQMLNEQERSNPQPKHLTVASCCQGGETKTAVTPTKTCGSCCQQPAKQAPPTPTK
jgi:hypothetical protein